MDNGDDRIFPAGVTCGSSGAPPCLYSTVPVWQIDQSAKTATLTFHQILRPISIISLAAMRNNSQTATLNTTFAVLELLELAPTYTK